MEAITLQDTNSLSDFCESIVVQDPGWIIIDTAPWHFQAAELPSGLIELRYQRWANQYGQMRLMTLHGPKICVQSFFLLPDTSFDFPTLAAETVTLGKSTQIAVLDVVAPPKICTTAWHCALDHSKPFHDKQLPDWFSSCASGHEVFFRKPHDIAMNAFWQSVAMCIDKWLLHKTEAVLVDIEKNQNHQMWLESYMDHHRDNSPGLPLLSRLFGEKWTKEFMRFFFDFRHNKFDA